jgi:signal transduction histidine kinase
MLQVQDFGCGIPADKLDSIFVNFGNLEEHKSINPSGRGLGLSICKSIIEQMGGSVSVDSKVGKGSSFNLTFKVRCDMKDQSKVHKSFTHSDNSIASSQ